MIDDIDQVDCPNCGVSRRVLSGVVERCPICGDYGVELNQEEEYQCPCGCEDNVENCTYASICPQCKKKFYGNGYARRDQLCPECSPTQRAADIAECTCEKPYQSEETDDGVCGGCLKPFRNAANASR